MTSHLSPSNCIAQPSGDTSSFGKILTLLREERKEAIKNCTHTFLIKLKLLRRNLPSSEVNLKKFQACTKSNDILSCLR